MCPMLFMHPLIPAAIAMVAGVLAAWQFTLPAWPLLGLAGLAGIWLLWAGWARGRIPAWLFSLFCLLIGAGLFSQHASRQLHPGHVSLWLNSRPQLLQARLVKAPEPRGKNTSLLVEARLLDKRLVSGLVSLSLSGDLPAPEVGELIRTRVRLKPFTSFANPGSFDYAAFMAAKGIRVRGYVSPKQGFAHLGPDRQQGVGLWFEKLRQLLGRLLDQLPPGPGRGLLRALILGQRGGLPRGVRDEFAATGTAHLLAISGLHMAMVWGLAVLVLRLVLAAIPGLALRVPVPKLAAGLALLPCLAYAALAGWSTPTLRAFIMAACLVGALMVNRPYRASGGLALAAIIITALWPNSPLELSFQLSFTAVCCILLVAAPLARRLEKRRPASRLIWWILGSWLVSAVVGPLLLPLTMLHFHQLPWLMIPANMVAVPLLASFILPMALLGAGLGLIWPQAGLAVWEPALSGAGWLLAYIKYLAAPDWAVAHLAGPGPWAAGLFYALVLALAVMRGRWRLICGAGLAAAMVAALILHITPPSPDGKLTVWMLDMDSGHATVARLPQGQVVLIDGGGWRGSEFDFGQAVIAPFLWSQGVSKLDIVAASNSSMEYCGGLPFIARWFEPREIWTNGHSPGRGAYAGLIKLANQRGIPLRTNKELSPINKLGGAEIMIVWPPPKGVPPGIKKASDASLWLGLALKETRLWLPGSNGYRVERHLAPRLPQGAGQVLAAANGGGRGSCTDELLFRLRPKTVLVSASCTGKKPLAAVRKRLRRAGAQILTTKAGGCIKLVTDGGGWKISDYLQPRRKCN